MLPCSCLFVGCGWYVYVHRARATPRTAQCTMLCTVVRRAFASWPVAVAGDDVWSSSRSVCVLCLWLVRSSFLAYICQYCSVDLYLTYLPCSCLLLPLKPICWWLARVSSRSIKGESLNSVEWTVMCTSFYLAMLILIMNLVDYGCCSIIYLLGG